MPEPSRKEMLLERNRQTLLDLDRDESEKQLARDILLCDIHRWLEEMQQTDITPDGR